MRVVGVWLAFTFLPVSQTDALLSTPTKLVQYRLSLEPEACARVVFLGRFGRLFCNVQIWRRSSKMWVNGQH